MSDTARLIRSGLAALAIMTGVTAATQFLFTQTAIAREHNDHKDHAERHHH